MTRVICQAGRYSDLLVNVFSKAEGKPYKTGYGWDRCHRTATWRFSTGCVHEHLMTWLLCARCAEELMRTWRDRQHGRQEEQARCPACKHADGHHCEVLASAEEGLARGDQHGLDLLAGRTT